MSFPIRVLVVEDHFWVRQGLSAVLHTFDDIEVVGEGGDGEQAIELADRLRPDIILMDINMPILNGIEATARIKAMHPTIRIIGLSGNMDVNKRAAILRAGAEAFLPKEVMVHKLYRKIREVAEGGEEHPPKNEALAGALSSAS